MPDFLIHAWEIFLHALKDTAPMLPWILLLYVAIQLIESKADVAASFQKAAIDVLVEKTVEGAKEKGVKVVTAGGGVAANTYLRQSLKSACDKHNLTLVLPEKRYCTDNAAMIASEGLVQFKLGNFADMSLTAKASIPLAATLETVQSRAAKKAGE